MCLCNIGSGGVGTHAWCHLLRVVQAKFETGMCEMNIFGLKFVVCLGTLVQDGLAHMRGVIWRAVPAKFKTEAGWDEKGVVDRSLWGSFDFTI